MLLYHLNVVVCVHYVNRTLDLQISAIYDWLDCITLGLLNYASCTSIHRNSIHAVAILEWVQRLRLFWSWPKVKLDFCVSATVSVLVSQLTIGIGDIFSIYILINWFILLLVIYVVIVCGITQLFFEITTALILQK